MALVLYSRAFCRQWRKGRVYGEYRERLSLALSVGGRDWRRVPISDEMPLYFFAPLRVLLNDDGAYVFWTLRDRYYFRRVSLE